MAPKELRASVDVGLLPGELWAVRSSGHALRSEDHIGGYSRVSASASSVAGNAL
jgi:hypothetical protein